MILEILILAIRIKNEEIILSITLNIRKKKCQKKMIRYLQYNKIDRTLSFLYNLFNTNIYFPRNTIKWNFYMMFVEIYSHKSIHLGQNQ